MKQNISPQVAVGIVAVALLLAAVLAYRVYTGPTSVPANTGAEGKSKVNPRSGGLPTEKDLERMREYQRTHPGAPSSLR